MRFSSRAHISRLSLSRLGLLLLSTLFLNGCADGTGVPAPSYATSEAKNLSRVYRLSIGDKLRVAVFGETNLSGDTEVGTLGTVDIALIGDVPAKGRTVSEFRRTVVAKLSNGYLKNPKVTVEVLNYRPIYVHGEVKTGGEFPYRTGVRMRDLIATAGGYTYRANKNYLFLERDGHPPYRITMPTNMPVLPGDNIRIPERFF